MFPKKRFNKKGDVEIQINWIFVLIVGGIILIFFIGIVMKQKTVSTTKLNINIRESLDTIFTSSQAASGTSNLINTPSLDVEFDCTNYFVGDYETGISKSLGQTRIVFTPTRLEGKQLVTWSVQWDMPYKVIDFLYIIPKEMRYIFVHDSSTQEFAEEIFNLLPAEMNKELLNLDTDDFGNLQYQNNYKTRVISFVTSGISAQLHESFEETDLSLLNIVPSLSTDETGDLVFMKYSKDPVSNSYSFQQDDTFIYLDYNPEFVTEKRYPTLFAAIITDSAPIYGCMLTKAFKRFSFVTQIHSDRIAAISNDLMDPNGQINQQHPLASRGCVPGLYKKGDDALLDLLSKTDSTNQGSCVNNLNNPSVCNLYFTIEELVAGNRRVQEESCPLIY
jgi:hypothetical protein